MPVKVSSASPRPGSPAVSCTRASASACIPDDYYAYGADRGGIDERWFASTTDAANEGRVWHEGQSFVLFEGQRFLLKRRHRRSRAPDSSATPMWDKYGRWPVYSKFFDNMGPIPHHMHQRFEDAKLVGQEGKPESYYFAPQYNNCDNNFPYTFMGLEPGTTKDQVRRCLENWNQGDNGILDLSKAYRLKRGTGWLIPPGVLHAPGSLCTYEPQWGSDVFGMYQNLVEGRDVPWSLLVKDMPRRQAPGPRLHRRPTRLGAKRRPQLQRATTTSSRSPPTPGDGWQRRLDRLRQGRRLPALQRQATDPRSPAQNARSRTRRQRLDHRARQRPHRQAAPPNSHHDPLRRRKPKTRSSSRHEAATRGVEIENTGSEPLEGLRYFGPDTFAQRP